MQDLLTVLETPYGKRYVGPVWANIDTFSADVVTFQAAGSFLSGKGFTVVTGNLADSDSAFTGQMAAGLLLSQRLSSLLPRIFSRLRMVSVALRALPIAETTEAGPVCTSPIRNTPGTLVSSV